MVVPRRIWVCGSGTEIGKTHVARALSMELRSRGIEVAARKPVESGFTEDDPTTTDAHLLAVASAVPFEPPIYRFPDPVSPHLAARRAGTQIEAGAIARWLDAIVSPCQVIETAGGLLSPLAPGLCNLDLVLAARPDAVLLVAPDRLGALHDTTAALLALDARGLRDHTIVVLSAPAAPDTATGTNAQELATLGIVRDAITFPRAPVDDAATRRAAAELAEALLRRFT